MNKPETFTSTTDPVSLGPEVRCRFLNERGLPLMISPAAAEQRSAAALLRWAGRNIGELDDVITRHGAILLRGFAIDDTATFEALSEIFPAFEMGYEAGATSRAKISGKVYEATRVPAEVWIMLHQEMAYLPRYPAKLAFYCHVAPDQGGETTIGNMRRVTAALPERLMTALETKGVRYRRNYLSPDTQDGRTNPVFTHRNWLDAFYTDDKATVEAACVARKLDFEWLPDGSITTWNTLPGVARHPRTGERIYFSQLHTQTPHRRWMGEATWANFSAVYGLDIPKPFDATFGDGEPLADEDLLAIYAALDEVTVSFPWQHGDVMIIDNLLTGHGRNPYQGTRDVQVALIG